MPSFSPKKFNKGHDLIWGGPFIPTRALVTESNIFEKLCTGSKDCFIFIAHMDDEHMYYWWRIGKCFLLNSELTISAFFEFCQPPHEPVWNSLCDGDEGLNNISKTPTCLRVLYVLYINWEVKNKIRFDLHVAMEDRILCKQIDKNAKCMFFTLTFDGVFLKI